MKESQFIVDRIEANTIVLQTKNGKIVSVKKHKIKGVFLEGHILKSSKVCIHLMTFISSSLSITLIQSPKYSSAVIVRL